VQDHWFFSLALAFILMHEMDAMRCHEWRIFPGLSYLSDHVGFVVFMAAHIPLFGLLIYFMLQPGADGFIRGVNIFLVVHFFLHVLFLWHPRNEFKDWISWTIITGAAVFAALDLVW